MKIRTVILAAITVAATCGASRADDSHWPEARTLLKQLRQTSAAAAKASGDERKVLQDRQQELQARFAEQKKILYGGQWARHEFQTPAHWKEKDGKAVDMTMIIWLPPDVPKICGVFISLWGAIVHDPFLRAGAKEGGLAIACFKAFNDRKGFDGMFNYTTGAPAALEGAMAKAAEITGHPELKDAPFLTAGMSATVIGARNMAYWRPDRTLGVIHASGGNMHHCRYDPNLTLAGVPFLAVNGEMESCGPEGGGHMSGAAGIRPEYGFQTQWVMMRESMIERQVNDPTHLMNLLVMPNAGHGGWSDDTAYVCGLFMAKAARYRLPGGYPDAKATAGGCVRIAPRSGWLTDANLKAPQFKPAPYDKYEGDPGRAFWHFDEEMALATTDYHANVFQRPDPAWGPLDVEAVRAFNLSRSDGPESALKALLVLCDAKDDSRRAETVGYIGRLGSAAVGSIPRLIAMFGERPVPSLTESLATSLARLAPPSTQYLLDATKNAEPNIRTGAILALGQIGQPADRIFAATEVASADAHPAVRRASLDTLMQMKADPARVGAAARPVLDDLSAAGDAIAFSNTSFSVVLLGSNAVAAAMPAFIRAATNPHPAIFASSVAGILAQRPKPPIAAIPALSAAILTADTNRWVTAVNAIGKIDASGATNLVLACMTQLHNKDSILANFALELIGRLAPKAGTPEFRTRSVRQLLEVLEGKESAPLRRRAARAIGAFGADAKVAVPALKMALDEGDLKDAAQKSLTDIGASGGPNLEAEMQ
jgi:HEAT repeat protein